MFIPVLLLALATGSGIALGYGTHSAAIGWAASFGLLMLAVSIIQIMHYLDAILDSQQAIRELIRNRM